MTQTPAYRKVILASRLMLASVWIAALSSIPSAQRFKEQLDAGVAPKDITTWFATLLLLVTLASIFAWFAVVNWMRERYDESQRQSPGAMRLSRTWITWSWLLPIVSLWYPKRMIDDLLGASAADADSSPTDKSTDTRLWWATWITYTIMSNLTTLQLAMLPTNSVPFQPNVEIAAACILTASYTVWGNIVRKIG